MFLVLFFHKLHMCWNVSVFPYFYSTNLLCIMYVCGEGPGCSSIGYGAAVELGPLRVAKKGSILEFNQNSWNQGSPPLNLYFS